jgi:hypothetical protein
MGSDPPAFCCTQFLRLLGASILSPSVIVQHGIAKELHKGFKEPHDYVVRSGPILI